MKVKARGLVIGSLVATFVVLAACSNQGEGERCDFDNGNDDCQDGLVCVPRAAQGNRGAGYGTVNPPYNSSDRCCPLPRTTATHPACILGTGVGTEDASPGDAGDAGSDASGDAATDDAGDASSDAPSDG